ncbi:MAG: MogA/MoaB family molybdenum cofactor biosynthesis protein [Eubacteriaceae bacterium]|nr:MogA/MoaB family molybdenum cofactor biosynthesis protein [Eubacteriaceae bacterium]
MIRVGILTSSDKGYAGERVDESGKLIADRVKEIPGEVAEYILVPDETEAIKYSLIQMTDEMELDLILTTGGTGMSPRDITPEATLAVIDRLVPGIPEAMRAKSLEITSRAMLSRATAGIRKKTLIINMPGSKKAVDECLDVIIPVLAHAIEILRGEGGECGRKDSTPAT